MTREDKKKWLWRYRCALGEVESLEGVVAERLSRAQGLSTKPLGTPGGNAFGSGERAVLRHMEAVDRLKAAKAEAARILDEELAAIGAVHGVFEQSVLRYRYINGFDWPEIRRRLPYTENGLFHLHQRALDRLVVGEKAESGNGGQGSTGTPLL